MYEMTFSVPCHYWLPIHLFPAPFCELLAPAIYDFLPPEKEDCQANCRCFWAACVLTRGHGHLCDTYTNSKTDSGGIAMPVLISRDEAGSWIRWPSPIILLGDSPYLQINPCPILGAFKTFNALPLCIIKNSPQCVWLVSTFCCRVLAFYL